MKPIHLAAFTLLFLLVTDSPSLFIPKLYGQSDTGRITGTITDASSAVVPNAKVTVKNEKTGQSRKVTANDQGAYIVTQLGPSTYALTAEDNGMAPPDYTAITLPVQQE